MCFRETAAGHLTYVDRLVENSSLNVLFLESILICYNITYVVL